MPEELNLKQDAQWKQRYRLPTTYGIQIANANPAHGLAISSVSGVEQLYAWHVPTGRLTQLTNRPEGVGNTGDGIPNAAISPDGNYIYYLDDHKGDETGHFVRVPFEGGATEDITPTLPPYVGFLFGFSQSGNRIGFTSIIDGVYAVYYLEVEPGNILGQPKILHQHTQQTIGPIFSSDGTIAVIEVKRPGTGSYDLIAVGAANGNEMSRLSDGNEGGLEIYLSSPLIGDMRFLALSSHTGEERPLLWNPLTGERLDLALNGVEGDVIPMDWVATGHTSSRMLFRQNIQVAQRIYSYDVDSGSVQQLQHSNGMFGTTEPRSIYFGPNGTIFAIWEDSVHPRQLVELDSETGEQRRVVLAASQTPTGQPRHSVTFPSSDGESVQGWLAVPTGKGPFPTIIAIHGGPEFAVLDTFDASCQCWLDHGFAHLTVNYRGSACFGRAFQEKIRGDLGHWEVEDIIAARNWLVQQGYTDAKQVFLTGWSYGGYLTLQTLGKQPDLWAGGMAGIAISDFTMNDDDGSMIKAYFRGLLGGTPQEKPEQYARSSPISYVEQVAAPVLIIQGRNDSRCTPRQIEVYESRMKELGKAIEVHWFDAGHGTSAVEEQIAHQELMLRFVYSVLAQEGKK